jgi:hypothetical protein
MLIERIAAVWAVLLEFCAAFTVARAPGWDDGRSDARRRESRASGSSRSSARLAAAAKGNE